MEEKLRRHLYRLLILFSPHLSYAVSEDFSPATIRTHIAAATSQPGTLFHSSQGQDIIAVIGKTGSGKSTLLNYLAGHPLVATEDGDIDLAHTENQTAVPIGLGSDSQTRYPQSISIGDLKFYDLPGFHDTAGTEQDLVNTALIKQILEEARSLRLIFVVGLGDLTEGRGQNLGQTFDVTRTLLGGVSQEAIHNASLFVVTKSRSRTLETHHAFMRRRLSEDAMGSIDR